MRVKIYGAGSIGNHLANASRRQGWSVDLCDTDGCALTRTREQIYPGRYGAWDPAIALHTADRAPKGGHDLICIGTPPDSHLSLAREALAEKPRALLIEKPLCPPDLEGAQTLADQAKVAGVSVFVGYDHVVGAAAERVAAGLASGAWGKIEIMDVEFREHWGGIFAAHPWLDGPHDSYLGFWRRGGGAAGEHSHAANLWQHFAHSAGAGRVVSVSATLDYVRTDRVDYDRLCLMTLRTEHGLVGRVVQDVITRPARKWARVQGERGHAEWRCGVPQSHDSVFTAVEGHPPDEHTIPKTRPDDFIRELAHIEAALAGAPERSPIALQRGLETALVIAAAHLSAELGRTIAIDHSKGCRRDALSAI